VKKIEQKPWEKGYEKGLDDGFLGKRPKIKKVTNGPFASIYDRDVKRAHDKGYLVGYEDGLREFRLLLQSMSEDRQKMYIKRLGGLQKKSLVRKKEKKLLR